MPLASLLKPLLLPPTLLVLLALGGWLLARWRPWLGRGVTWTALLLLYAMSTPVVGGHLLRALQTYPPLDAETARASGAQAIVVLSGDQRRRQPDYGGESAGPRTLERLRRGVRLQRETGLPLLVSGGLLPGHESSHADAMADAVEQDFR